ncbi:uncharacterized protein [Littorina saxatilis]|uniref:uncharacterized protein n=1 Tax=Littorina saxatilis TaxID=31220 RepID=UPI0038B4837D
MMTSLLAVFFLLGLCGTGCAMMCYICDNSKTSACGENFKAYQFDAIQCDENNGRNKCGKQEQDPNEDGWIGIIRSCYPIGALPGLNDSNGCHRWFNPDLNFSALYCFCDFNYCNAATSTTIGGGPTTDPVTRVLYFLALLLALFLPYYFSASTCVLESVDVTHLSRRTLTPAVTANCREALSRGRTSRKKGFKVPEPSGSKRPSTQVARESNSNHHGEPLPIKSRSTLLQNGVNDAHQAFRFVSAVKRFQRDDERSTEGCYLVNTAAFCPLEEHAVFKETFLRLKDEMPVEETVRVVTGTGSAPRLHPDMRSNDFSYTC